MTLLSSGATDRELMKTMGQRLQTLRKQQGLTALEVAEHAGLDRTTVSRAENGDNPTLLTLLRMLRVYGRINALDTFLPEPEVSPIALLKQKH